ncbi:MAG: diguanylate cyclase [Clostridiales bacterium]|nr:diguanylate cyclase [Clostridiales bacterium]
MHFSLWKKVVTNNHRFTPDRYEYHQVYFLNSLLITTIAVCVINSVMNITLFKCYLGAAIEIIALPLTVAALVYFHKTNNIKTASLFAVLILSMVLAAMIYTAQNKHFVLVLVCIFPPIAYFLLGVKRGTLASLLFTAMIFAYMLLGRNNWDPAPFSDQALFNITFSMLFLAIVLGNYEKTRKIYADALKEKNSELSEKSAQLKLLLDSTAEGIYGIDKQGNCTFCNKSCLRLLGYDDQEQLLGKNMHLQIHHSRHDGEAINTEDCMVFKTITSGESAHVDSEVFWRSDGTCMNVEYYSYPQYNSGAVTGAVITFTDNTERRQTEKRIKDFSTLDVLTGLYNRRRLDEKLKDIDIEKNLPISIIYGDMNSLKLTNDIFGHSAGDELIRKNADILKSVCRQQDIVARVAGDEFVILLPGTSTADAEKIMSRVRAELAKSNIFAVKCSMSMGCDTKNDALEDINITMANAENNMYKEKTLNRKLVSTDILNTIIASFYDRGKREKEHSLHVGELCRCIGEAMGLPAREVKKLKEAGFLHDIGKIVVDENIFSKQSLTDEEEHLLAQHPVAGYRILSLFENTLDIAEGVFSHHERWDGSGYPKGLKGEEIPLLSRIIAVAERYDSLINGREYIRLNKEDALNDLRKLAGVKLDPQIVDIFLTKVADQ